MVVQDANGNSARFQGGGGGGGGGGPRIAVVGAGLTGLVAAQGLKKQGFEVAVFERFASIDARSRDWTILINWGMSTLEKLLPEPVFKRLPEAVCNPYLKFTEEDESIPAYSGVTGEMLFCNPTPGGRRISRLRLRRVFSEGLDIRWGKVLCGLEPGDDSIRLTFDDGSSHDADYVLGADGVSSKVRELLMGPEAARPFSSGYLIANCAVRYGDAEKVKAVVKAHSVCALMMGSSRVAMCGVMHVDDPEDMATWGTFWGKLWKGQPLTLQGQEAIDYAKGDLSGLCEPFRSAVEWTPDGSACYIDDMKCWIPTPWETHGGRVTLAGDAAHPMLPFRGQGLQHAIVDAENFIDALVALRDSGDRAEREEAMAAYGADVVHRGAASVAQSLREAEKALKQDTVGEMLMVTKGHGRIV